MPGMELNQLPRPAARWVALTWKLMMGIAALTAIYIGLTR
jgi:hypothetical protein